jgi:hypothetical protein
MMKDNAEDAGNSSFLSEKGWLRGLLLAEGATQAPVIEARILQATHVFETERKVKKIPDKYNV